MDFELNPGFQRPLSDGAAAKNDVKPGDFEGSKRSRSAVRLKYEAETHLIQRKLGDLETIRATLGLSQRKICQLLLVDPSAWTRWVKGAQGAPPHIYRMLQWYLALEEKYPVLEPTFWLNTVSRVANPATDADQRKKLDAAGGQIAELRAEVERLRVASDGLEKQLKDHRASMKRQARNYIWGLIAAGAMAALFLFFFFFLRHSFGVARAVLRQGPFSKEIRAALSLAGPAILRKREVRYCAYLEHRSGPRWKNEIQDMQQSPSREY